MKTISVITVSRSDYGIYRTLLKKIKESPGLKLNLIAAGMHLSKAHGYSINTIINDGFDITDTVDMDLSSDSPPDISRSMGVGLMGFSRVYSRSKPDIIVVMGDRFEMHCAALAALPFTIPVAHIHGGELSSGAMDDSLRHSITKLSHLHFVSTQEYADRVLQLGEEPWRITVSGAPALEAVVDTEFMGRNELEEKFKIDLSRPFICVTYHPVTLEYSQTKEHIKSLLKALEVFKNFNIIFTSANADTCGSIINLRIREFTEKNPHAYLVQDFGQQAYFSIMKLASAMVGNSSSGIIEAASFRLSVVNIGRRQEGRAFAGNVINCSNTVNDIVEAVKTAVSPGFKDSLQDLENPYFRPGSSDIICKKFVNIKISDELIIKKFYNMGNNIYPLKSHNDQPTG